MNESYKNNYRNIAVRARARIYTAAGLCLAALLAVFLVSLALGAASKEANTLEASIHQLSAGDSAARRIAAIQLGQKRDAKSVPILLKALRDSNELVRQAAADSLGAIKNPDSATGLMEAAKNDSNADVRQAALVALIAVSQVKAIPVMIDGLKDKDVGVRSVAVTMLGKLHSEDAVPGLIEALGKASESAIKSSILQALAAIGSPAALKPVFDLMGSPDAQVQLNAIGTFGDLIDNMGIVATLTLKLSSTNPEIAAASAVALAKMGDHSGLSILVGFLSHADRKVRFEAAAGLATMRGEAAAVAALGKAFKTEMDPAVKEKIGSSLKALAETHKK